MPDLRRARDLGLLDSIDGFVREPFAQNLWRVAREGRDAISGAPSVSRWCDGTFDVLYTSMERDGALAEVHALLSMQPVFPSKFVRSKRCGSQLMKHYATSGWTLTDTENATTLEPSQLRMRPIFWDLTVLLPRAPDGIALMSSCLQTEFRLPLSR
jgi:hypothetical protein